MKTARDIRKIIADSRSGHLRTPTSKIKIVHWRGPLKVPDYWTKYKRGCSSGKTITPKSRSNISSNISYPCTATLQNSAMLLVKNCKESIQFEDRNYISIIGSFMQIYCRKSHEVLPPLYLLRSVVSLTSKHLCYIRIDSSIYSYKYPCGNTSTSVRKAE